MKEAAAAAAAAAAEAAAVAAFGVNYARACGASKDQPCPAMQISTGHGGVAERAVDGSGEGHYDGASCTHTDGSPAGQKQWWRVDMQQEVVVTTLEIVGRADCCEDRTNGYSIFVGDEEPGNLEKNAVCVQDQPHLPKIGGQTVTCTSPVRGRYVYFVIPPGGMLTLCEVEVFGSEAPSAAAAAAKTSTSSAASGEAAAFKGEKVQSDSEKIDYLRNAVKEIKDFLKKLFPDGKLPAGNESFDASGASGSDGGVGTECCAAQCTGLAAPLTNKQVDIDSTSRGSGSNHYLDRQNVDCGGSPMSGFKMRTVKEMSEISYRIQCSEGADLNVHEVLC